MGAMPQSLSASCSLHLGKSHAFCPSICSPTLGSPCRTKLRSTQMELDHNLKSRLQVLRRTSPKAFSESQALPDTQESPATTISTAPSESVETRTIPSVGLQAALINSNAIRGLVLLNISLRMLHIKKQPWYIRPFVKSFQNILRNTDLGKRFFQAVATPQSVKRILCECYHDKSAVTDELVEKILLPGLEPGAVDVFLDFICYSGGPLAEEMLPDIKCPVLFGWGEKDPWEPVELGRPYGAYECVEEFLVLPNVGHCPQDEAPHLINPLVEQFVLRHTAAS